MNKIINDASRFLQIFYRDDIASLANILNAEANEDYDTIINALDDLDYTVARLRDYTKYERDRRALEAENTEYDCGHNVKYRTEEL